MLFHDPVALGRGGKVPGRPVCPKPVEIDKSIEAEDSIELDKAVLFHGPVALGRGGSVAAPPVCPKLVEPEKADETEDSVGLDKAVLFHDPDGRMSSEEVDTPSDGCVKDLLVASVWDGVMTGAEMSSDCVIEGRLPDDV